MKNNYLIYIILIIFLILILTFSVSYSGLKKGTDGKWPLEKTTIITSGFGERIDPVYGYQGYHNGIDIGGRPGENLIAVDDGIVTKTEFYGGYGFTICIQGSKYKFLYGHVDPDFIVKLNMRVRKGDIIGKVGKLHVYGVKNNPYKDQYGNPTNGHTTGPHLHFSVIENGKFINPYIFLNSESNK